MSHKDHFCMSGYVNKQNCLDCARNKTHELQGRPLHSWQVTAGCESSSHGNTGPSFFDKAEGRTVTLHAERYIVILRTFLWSDITSSFVVIPTRYSVGIIAAAHTAQISMKVLRTVFPGRIISRFGDMTWPASSPDLAVPGYFLCVWVKSEVNETHPAKADDLKQKNSRVHSRNP
jgi:hypothetical protein